MSSMDEVILAIDFIEANLTKEMDLDVISGAVHYLKYHLHRVFFDTVSLAIHDYIQYRQLTESAKLLISSYKPTVQIASLFGYQSRQAFTNASTAMCKMPPNMYREDERFYPLQFRFNFEESYEMLDGGEEASREILLTLDENISDWMELVGLVVDGFPHLNEEEYIRVLRQRINTRQALILKDGGTTISIILFSHESGNIDFMESHLLYRKGGAPKAMLDKVTRELLRGKEISITTYQEDDEADTGYREEVMGMGFAGAKLLVEYGYPTQRFILQQEEWNYE